MNEIVRRNYPAANLPEDLRAGLPEGARVDVTISSPPSTPPAEADDGLRRLFEQVASYRASHPERRTVDEIVADIRVLRDEWDR